MSGGSEGPRNLLGGFAGFLARRGISQSDPIAAIATLRVLGASQLRCPLAFFLVIDEIA
jgi:hypothetical protein